MPKPISHSQPQMTAGFSIIEIFVIIAIVSILATIAVPGWLTFMNQQRATSVRDQLLQELRTTQSEAQRMKRAKTLRFIPSATTASGLPEVERDSIRKPLVQEKLSPGALSLQVLDGNQQVLDRLIFQSNGSLDLNQATPIRILISVPAQSSDQQCIIIPTALGGMRSAKGAHCDAIEND